MSILSSVVNDEDMFVAGLESLNDTELTDMFLETESDIDEEFKDLIEATQLVCGLEAIALEAEGKSDDTLEQELDLLLNGYGLTAAELGCVGGVEGIRDVLAKMGRGISNKVNSLTKNIKEFRRNNLSILGIRRKRLVKVLERLKGREVIPTTIEIGVAASRVQSTVHKVKSVKDVRAGLDEWDTLFRDFQNNWLPEYEKGLSRLLDTMGAFKMTDTEGSIHATATAALDLPFQKLVALTKAKKGTAEKGRRTSYGSPIYIGQGQLAIDLADDEIEKKYTDKKLKGLIRKAISQQAFFHRVKWPGKKPIEARLETSSKKDVIELVEKTIAMLDFAKAQLDRIDAQGFGNNFLKTYGKLWANSMKSELAMGSLFNMLWIEYSKFNPRVLVWQHNPRNSLLKHSVYISEGMLRIGEEAAK